MTDTLQTSTSLIGAFTPEAFEKALASHAGAPAWWLERKRKAYETFASLPMPARTDEGWRFSNRAGLSLEAGKEVLAAAPRISCADAEALAKGVVATTLRKALQTHPDLLREHFMAQPQKLGSQKFAALHAAFVSDGAFIHIPKGIEVASRITIEHGAPRPGEAAFPHTLVIAEDNTKVEVVDIFGGDGGGKAPGSGEGLFACGANDLYAGHGSNLRYVAVQDWPGETLSFQLNSTLVRRDARVQSLNLHLGGRQSRHESLSQLQAPGAFSEMLALTVADGSQEFDQRTLQIHQAPNTKSDLLYKNALMDRAKTVFSGLIIVDQDAQKTDAYQSNRNLILSEEAEADSLPGLEIQANDVRCTHGATSSRIDPDQMFYLQSRGIAPEAARELLIAAFFEEVLNRMEDDELHALLRERIQAKLDR